MRTNYSLLFYLKRPKHYVSGPAPLYMRITVDGIPKEFSIGRSVEPARWRAKANRAAGTNEESRALNRYLETLIRNMEDIHTALVRENAVITSELLKRRFLGVDDETHYLIEMYLDHNQKIEALLGKGYKDRKSTRLNSSHVKISYAIF